MSGLSGYRKGHPLLEILSMTASAETSCTAFQGHHILLAAPLADVALAVKRAADATQSILVFDDRTGLVVDLDLRGTDADIVARLPPGPTGADSATPPTARRAPRDAPVSRGRGRPKLGVVAREVTLLPRHWEWLAAQPGGASVTLRRLVEQARQSNGRREQRRAAQEAAYRFMLAIAGDLPGYEEATRALFADDRSKLERNIAGWPEDIRGYTLRLAFGGFDAAASDRPE